MTERHGATGAGDQAGAARPPETTPAGDLGTLLGGALMIGFGLWFGIRAADMTIGSATNMGPGYFPLALSVISGLMGLVLVLQGMRATAARVEVEWRPMIFVSLSVLAFAVGIRYFGLVPAVVGTIVVSAVADPDFRIVPTLILAAAMSFFAWLVFTIGLGLALPPFAWGL